jgi:Domain of unknown function (DUF4091)
MHMHAARAAGAALAMLLFRQDAAQSPRKLIAAWSLYLAALSGASAAPLTASHFLTAPGPITAVWANTGEDKVTQDELRTATGRRPVLNRSWDGSTVRVFGARNEMVAFNLVLEAGSIADAGQVSVQFNRLTGPNGFLIKSTPTNKHGVFDWTERDIELFHVRYLKIRGLSRMSYGIDDERHIPERFRRPKAAEGSYIGGWAHRPDHDKLYPEIAVPIEVTPTFGIGAKKNQSIWADIYIPKNAPAGTFSGDVLIRIAGEVIYRVPVRLTVRDFTLPDMPNAKTMVATAYSDVADRYTGKPHPDASSPSDLLTKLVMDRQMMLAHRHKISLIDDNGGATPWPHDRPRPEWVPRLSGALFTAPKGYRGPGTGVGSNVFSIATYGRWQAWWGTPTAASMWSHTTAWENWFAANYPATQRFLYLADEPDDFAELEKWASWVRGNLETFATVGLLNANTWVPSLAISGTWFRVGPTARWHNAVNAAHAAGKKVILYNGQRPAGGSFAIEDDGVALRQLAWGQYKKKIDRWFFWSATYYNNYQGGLGHTNVFVKAATFSGPQTLDVKRGITGWNYSNGDGVLFYPGIDRKFPEQSRDLHGPIASLRLKHWRRGIQDVDYLTMAAKVNPAATAALVQRMVPKALWEYGVTDPLDPTWLEAPISWSTNPDLWEGARLELANTIEGN